MNTDPSFDWLDLHRLSDFSLDEAELRPLMRTLASDLEGQMVALAGSLSRGDDAQTVHRHLHALKGMAGMFAKPALVQLLTEADDACRRGQWARGEPLARALVPQLTLWLAEVRGWLQRYS